MIIDLIQRGGRQPRFALKPAVQRSRRATLPLWQSVLSQDAPASAGKKFWQKLQKRVSFPLSLLCYLLIPLQACQHQGWQQARSPAGNPRQDPSPS